MASSLDKLESLRQELSCLSTAEDKLISVESWLQLQSSAHEPPQIVHDSRTEIGDDTDKERQEGDRLMNLLIEHGVWDTFRESQMKALSASMLQGIQPISFLSCANSDPAKVKKCTKEGKQACSACRLVKYCSKVIGIPVLGSGLEETG